MPPWTFLAYYDTLTHFAASCKTNKTNYEIISEAAVLPLEISFQRNTASAKLHLFFILLHSASSLLMKVMALMKKFQAVVSEPPHAFI